MRFRMALGYGALAAREVGEAFERGEFSFARYDRRVAFRFELVWLSQNWASLAAPLKQTAKNAKNAKGRRFLCALCGLGGSKGIFRQDFEKAIFELGREVAQ